MNRRWIAAARRCGLVLAIGIAVLPAAGGLSTARGAGRGKSEEAS